ncbi:MAG: ABC transporter permease [Lachnospiraceae bacterium]|nr:ABC transporter permease [Lachnospiraceae bacterium]
MGRFIEYCKIAFFNIKSNKVRAFLTMLGIIIGISSVVAIVSLGNGFKKAIDEELSNLAGNTLEVYAMDYDLYFYDEDLEALMEKDRHIVGISPLITLNGEASYKDLKNYTMSAKLGNELLDEAAKYDIIYGRYFTKEECQYNEKVCVIDKSSARKIFGTENAVGMTINLYYGYNKRGDTFRIVGIRDDNESQLGDMIIGNGSVDVHAEVPYNSFIEAIGLSAFLDGYDAMVIILDDSKYASDVLSHTKAILEARHDIRGENLIYVLDYNAIFSVISSSLTMITLLIMLVAAISLFVGGIGVMNIMLVSVTERTKEIGIRKALGARTGSILTQFLVEAGSISLLGGVIGILLGLGGAEFICFLISNLTKATMIADFNPFFILGIALFSMSIGVFFGIYPARKAAKLSPIDALRRAK